MNYPELTAQLKHLYGFGTVQILGRIEGGYWSEVLSLTTDRGSFALRRYHPDYVPQGVQWEHGLMRFLGSTIPQVPVPVEQIDGSTHFVDEGRVAALFPLMSGHHPDSVQAMEEFIIRSARGRAEGPQLVGHNAFESRGEVANRIGQLRAERNYCRVFTSNLIREKRSPVFGPIQGDYYPGNLLIEEGRITAVLDWDECRSDWQCYELARATWEFSRDQSSDSLDRPRVVSFLEGYQDAGGPVPAAEFDLLTPFMRCALLQDLLFGISEATKGRTWEVSYSAYLLRSLENLEATEWAS